MYSRRATLFSFNSIRALSKVCKTRSPYSLESVKVLPFARNLSNAAERSDFYTVNYVNYDENRTDSNSYNGFYGGIPDGFNAEDLGTWQQNCTGVDGANGLTSVNGHFQQSSSGHYSGQYGMSFGSVSWQSRQQSSSGFYGEQYGMSQQNSGGHFAESAGIYQQDLHNAGMYQQYETGVHNSNAGNYWQNWNVPGNEGMVGSQVTNDFRQNGDSVEVAKESQSRSKIVEFEELCKDGKLKEATQLLVLLEQQCGAVDLPQYIMLMKACGENKSLEEAKSVHEHLVRSIPHLEVKMYNKILEMYSQCSSMDDAFAVFDQMPKRNLTSWDVMISGLAKNGLGEDSIELFEQFKRSGLKSDGQMFIGVFSACGVLGDIVEGILHFESMSQDYGISASMEHYVGVVAMLGSAGYLDEALEFIEMIPMEPGVEIWETLMNFCRMHGNMELGDHCAELVELLDPSRLNKHSWVGLLPIKSSELAGEKNKLSGQNLLDVRSRVHEYRAGDRSHPDHEKIYALLGGLQQHMKEVGYKPDIKFVLHDIELESKEEALMAHSERLATAQGLLNSPARAPLRIIKNLRACGDCHTALKMISRIVGREIVARDAKRFHHFKDGSCSCNDYW